MLITLEDFKQHAEVNTDDDDDSLDIYCGAVDAYLKEYLNRQIEKTTHTEYFNGDELDNAILLKDYPVALLTSLQYRTGTYSSPTWNDINEDYYQLDDENGMILLDIEYPGLRNIKAVYEAGYSDDEDDQDEGYLPIPYPVKLAAIKLMSKVYNKKRSEGFRTEEVSQVSIEWDKFMSDDITALLAPYKRHIL